MIFFYVVFFLYPLQVAGCRFLPWLSVQGRYPCIRPTEISFATCYEPSELLHPPPHSHPPPDPPQQPLTRGRFHPVRPVNQFPFHISHKTFGQKINQRCESLFFFFFFLFFYFSRFFQTGNASFRFFLIQRNKSPWSRGLRHYTLPPSPYIETFQFTYTRFLVGYIIFFLCVCLFYGVFFSTGSRARLP